MFKSGFVGIIGKPNAGKSTLLNTILGEKIAITTHKPQTTRNRITGIKNFEDAQIIFVDTPGIHASPSPLNRYMVSAAVSTFGDTDILLLLVEADKKLNKDDYFIIESLKEISIPVILVINKVDLIKKDALLVVIDKLRQLHAFTEIIPLSALTGDNVDRLVTIIQGILPEGPRFFPEDMITDSSERFMVAEIIREKVMLLTHQEVPYSTAVLVEAFKEDEQRNLLSIQAIITVERDSQKGIIIGKSGSMIKKLGQEARLEIEGFFGMRVFLELFVRVRKDWSHDPRMLQEFGYKIK